jgi:hypothetical protein
MGIISKQIGWSQEANLLWEILRELNSIDTVMCKNDCIVPIPTTTSTTTIDTNCISYTLNNLDPVDTTFSYINCSGQLQSNVFIGANSSVNICAQLSNVNFNGEIINNGVCI